MDTYVHDEAASNVHMLRYASIKERINKESPSSDNSLKRGQLFDMRALSIRLNEAIKCYRVSMFRRCMNLVREMRLEKLTAY